MFSRPKGRPAPSFTPPQAAQAVENSAFSTVILQK
jgi:hypothetical protein